MRVPRTLIPALFLVAASFAAPGCATTGPGGYEVLGPGETVEFDGSAFQLRQVQEDFVLLRYRAPGDRAGQISGFIDEVFRVSRYDLGEGRWYAHEKVPGVCFQWLGLDSFALAHDSELPKGAEVVLLH